MELADGRRLRYLAGTRNVFKIRGPSLTHLVSVVIEVGRHQPTQAILIFQSDGLTEEDAVFIKSVSVENLRARLIWDFDCREWLSLFDGDCQISRTLYVEDEQTKLARARQTKAGADAGGNKRYFG